MDKNGSNVNQGQVTSKANHSFERLCQARQERTLRPQILEDPQTLFRASLQARQERTLRPQILEDPQTLFRASLQARQQPFEEQNMSLAPKPSEKEGLGFPPPKPSEKEGLGSDTLFTFGRENGIVFLAYKECARDKLVDRTTTYRGRQGANA